MSQQHDLILYLPPATFYLAGGRITHDDGQTVWLTNSEYKLSLHLLKKALVSPNGYLPKWFLINLLYPNCEEPDDVEQAIYRFIHNLRKKLGDPTHLKTLQGRGYQLRIPQEGFCTASVEEVHQLIQDLMN